MAGPDFSAILNALQTYAGQETRQGAAAFDASTAAVKTASDVTSVVRKRKQEDEDKAFLEGLTMDTPRGKMSAYAVSKLAGAGVPEAVRSMVLTASAIQELDIMQELLAFVKILTSDADANAMAQAIPTPKEMVPPRMREPAAKAQGIEWAKQQPRVAAKPVGALSMVDKAAQASMRYAAERQEIAEDYRRLPDPLSLNAEQRASGEDAALRTEIHNRGAAAQAKYRQTISALGDK